MSYFSQMNFDVTSVLILYLFVPNQQPAKLTTSNRRTLQLRPDHYVDATESTVTSPKITSTAISCR
jgi:hypothetical protein